MRHPKIRTSLEGCATCPLAFMPRGEMFSLETPFYRTRPRLVHSNPETRQPESVSFRTAAFPEITMFPSEDSTAKKLSLIVSLSTKAKSETPAARIEVSGSIMLAARAVDLPYLRTISWDASVVSHRFGFPLP